MTKKELIYLLSDYSDDDEVCIEGDAGIQDIGVVDYDDRGVVVIYPQVD